MSIQARIHTDFSDLTIISGRMSVEPRSNLTLAKVGKLIHPNNDYNTHRQ
jgi:hypothetical protein